MLGLASQPAPAASLADRIAEAIAERIVRGDLDPDMPIRQDHVAAEFGASHVPVREAFRKLEAQGLVVAAPRRGVRVAPLDPASVIEVIEMRAALETLALRHAIPNLVDADLAAASRALVDGEVSDDIAVWEAANRRFHRALMAPCRMPRLLAAIDDFHRASARYLFATWQGLHWQPRSDAEHRAILDACRARNVEAATAATARHILAAGHALAATL
ncbi:MAG: GntR family transcriptional regulator [Alphaproteobacteria bacterium]